MLLSVAVAGCTRAEPIGCNNIVEPVFSSFPVTVTDPSPVRDWIVANYAVSGELLRESTTRDGLDFYWSLNNKQYRVSVSPMGSFLASDWQGTKPTLKEVIACNGLPASYDAHQLPPIDVSELTIFAIWYPQKNMLIRTAQSSGGFVINEGTVFESVMLFGPAEFAIGQEKYKPWPAKLSDVQIVPWR